MKTVLKRTMAWREPLVWSFLLACGSSQCQSEWYQQGIPSNPGWVYPKILSTAYNMQRVKREVPNNPNEVQPLTDAIDQSIPFEESSHVCRQSNTRYDCIFRHVFIANVNAGVNFGHTNDSKWNNQSRLMFEQSSLRILPRSLVDAYSNVQLLNLERLHIETIERFALANGRNIRELHLSYNNIASLDEGVFDNLTALEILMMDGNQLSRLPPRPFKGTSKLKIVSMAGNNLARIEDRTFWLNPYLESVNVTSNKLVHFDLLFVPNIDVADVKNNQFEVLKIPSEIVNLDASYNRIRSVVAPADAFFIEVLSLSYNNIKTVVWLKPLTKLQSLDLSFNEIEDIAQKDFEQLTELKVLKLKHNRLFTFNIPSSLKRSLTELDLSHNNLVDVNIILEEFDKLEKLELHGQSRPFEATRHVCRASDMWYDCIFWNVFINNLNSGVFFGDSNPERNNHSRIMFVNSSLRILPKSLVDTFSNVELLNLERLQIETIERFAFANGRNIKELHLSYNKIASLDEGVFDNLAALDVLLMDGNQLSRLPLRLFTGPINLEVVSMAGNNLNRILDGTFGNNSNLESVNVANNKLTHFDLSLILRLFVADLKNNLLQELRIPSAIEYLDASNNLIRKVAAQPGSQVRDFNLSNNKINTVAWLKFLRQLQSLDLSSNEIEDITQTDFRLLAELKTLKLKNNRLFTFDIPSTLKGTLTELDLSHNNLVYVENILNEFEQLEELYLDHNAIVNANLEPLRNLTNLTLSHNDWDCDKLVSLQRGLPASTVVDYDTEAQCKQNYKRERGICCTVSDMPYHDRLIKYIAELSVAEKAARASARCSGAKVSDTAKSVSDAIASFGPPPSPTLAKEVQDMRLEVQNLKRRADQAINQTGRAAGKIDELMRTYRLPEEELVRPPYHLRKVFDHLKQRDEFKINETIAYESEKKNKEEKIKYLERTIIERGQELQRKKNIETQVNRQIGDKNKVIKKLEATKNKIVPVKRIWE